MRLLSLYLLIGIALGLPSREVAAQQPLGKLQIWDTGQPHAKPLTAADWTAQKKWKTVGRRKKPAHFAGDAVVSNGRILAVIRKVSPRVEVYATGTDRAPVRRADLQLLSPKGEEAVGLLGVRVVENTRGAARLQAVYRTQSNAQITAAFRIKRGGVHLETSPGAGAGALRVHAPSRFVVMPDFFADDILIDARRIPVASAELPSENFLLHPLAGGDSLAMCVFENSDQDVRVTFAGKGAERKARSSDIRFGKKGRIWLALLEGRDVWHEFEVKVGDAGQIRKLDWRAPFAAQWRTDFTRRNDLTDSWEMLYPAPDGKGFIKPSWLPGGSRGDKPSVTATGRIDVDAYKVGGPASNRLGPERKRWITVLGRYQYPCWTDADRNGYVQPLKHKRRDDLMFRGAALIYPINRLPETPLHTFTAVDVLRSTLGVGPCEYILNVESQRQDHVGRATCHVRRLLNEIYQNKQQKARRKEIEEYLSDGLDFVKHIRKRIDSYVAFGRSMREYLSDQRKDHPELARQLAVMEQIASELDERLAARKDGIKSPAFVVALNDHFRDKLLGYEGKDSLERLKRYTDSLTGVGGSQDGLVGECRWIVRALRQRAALAMAVDPEFAPIAREIRRRTQQVLLKPSAYEGARH